MFSGERGSIPDEPGWGVKYDPVGGETGLLELCAKDGEESGLGRFESLERLKASSGKDKGRVTVEIEVLRRRSGGDDARGS